MPVHSRRFHLLGGDWLYLQSCAGPHKTMLTGKIVGRVLETCSKQAAVPRRLGPLDRLRATQGCGIGSSWMAVPCHPRDRPISRVRGAMHRQQQLADRLAGRAGAAVGLQ